MWRALPKAFYERPATAVARDLLGRYLVRDLEGERLALRLVETEAYLGEVDRASHAWAGRRTARTEAMYLAGGHAYVYFVYGMHFCLNAVTGPAGEASAVLLRAGEPVAGEATMRLRRGLEGEVRAGQVAGGPARLCQALAVDRSLNMTTLWRGGLRIVEGAGLPEAQIASGPRVGVDYAGEAASWELRFAIRGNPHVSNPPGPAGPLAPLLQPCPAGRPRLSPQSPAAGPQAVGLGRFRRAGAAETAADLPARDTLPPGSRRPSANYSRAPSASHHPRATVVPRCP
jgi:DNA-3-methyladenine glycosylase